MLQKFNKLALCLTSAMTITAAYSNEYIVTNASEENKEQIYDIVSKFRFPSILSQFTQNEFKQKYQNHNLIDTFKTKEAEYNFLKTEINNIDKNAEVFAIPKSLYQFIVYDYFADTISSQKKKKKKKIHLLLWSNLNEQKKKFDLRKYAKANEKWGLTKACGYFMAHDAIKDAFWKVNEHAKNLYMKHAGNTEEIIHEIFDAFQAGDKSREGLLDAWNLTQQQGILYKMHAEISRIETMVGQTSEEKRLALKKYTTNCIISEAQNSNYTLYHGGKLDNPNSEIANRMSICFSDGLFSGYIFDAGASAYVYSASPNKLWKLELDRNDLLNGKYPIFIPPAFHLLSAAGNGELFHARTKVVQAVIDCTYTKQHIDNFALSIKSIIEPLQVGYALTQLPELYTTQNPQILLKKNCNDLYENTNQGIFDKDGAEKLKAMINTIKEVPEK